MRNASRISASSSALRLFSLASLEARALPLAPPLLLPAGPRRLGWGRLPSAGFQSLSRFNSELTMVSLVGEFYCINWIGHPRIVVRQPESLEVVSR